MIIKGFILETSQGGQRAKIRISEGEILDNVLMLHTYGETSNIENDESSQVLVLFANGSKTNAFGIPYNVLLQPSLELTAKAVGNFKHGNKMTFKAGVDGEPGENDVVGNTNFANEIDATGKINTAANYEVAGTKVVGEQGSAVTDPTGGVTIDAECRAALIALLAEIRTHGLIA